jgi:hypothetical protein
MGNRGVAQLPTEIAAGASRVRIRGRTRAVLRTLSAALVVSGLTQAAMAQTREPTSVPYGHSASRSTATKGPPALATGGAAMPEAAVASGRAPAPSRPARAATGAALSDAGAVEAKVLDGGTRVFKFGEIDIEGRLKSPQLVYFLRRVRAEFAAGDLGHRSFMREMSETRTEPSF